MTARTGAERKPNKWGRVRDFFIRAAAVCDRLTWAASLLACLILTAAVLAIVVLRYGFGQGYIELQDAATYAFAVLADPQRPGVRWPATAMSGSRWCPSACAMGYRRAADALALVLFLMPVFGLMVWAWWPQVVYSWSIREGVAGNRRPAGAVIWSRPCCRWRRC